MSFAQTTSAEGVPTRLQNDTLIISDDTAGTIITNTTPALSKSVPFSAPLGNYMAIGSVALPDNVTTGQWINLSIYAGASQLCNIGYAAPTGSGMIVPISFPITISALSGNALDFFVASQSGSIRVTQVSLVLMRV